MAKRKNSRHREAVKRNREVTEAVLIDAAHGLALLEPYDVLDRDGCLRPLDEMTPMARRAIKSIRMERYFDEETETTKIRPAQIVFEGKLPAIELSARFKGMLQPQFPDQGGINITLHLGIGETAPEPQTRMAFRDMHAVDADAVELTPINSATAEHPATWGTAHDAGPPPPPQPPPANETEAERKARLEYEESKRRALEHLNRRRPGPGTAITD